MKKLFFLILILALGLVSCNQKAKESETDNSATPNHDSVIIETDTTKTEHPKVNPKLYACPMHPEVQGELDDICPKCGMKLTKSVE
jgi:PBP1b-binding outer membrane lipoprotein LpoB